MPSINSIMVMGHLGRDAETKFTQSGVSITSFSVATEHNWKQNDEWQKKTDWHNVTAFKVSDKTLEQLKKGALVVVQGRMSYREYEKDGKKQRFSEIVAESVKPIAARASASEPVGTNSTAPEYSDDVPF